MNVVTRKHENSIERKRSWLQLLQLSPDELVHELENIRLAVEDASRIDK